MQDGPHLSLDPKRNRAPALRQESLSHDNGFGVLRLAFACLVLVSHAPELIDGNRSREILTRIFGSLSFGEVAVDGFFVISGALITASWLTASSWRDYLWRRVVRIYPGFLVAFAFCLLVVAPLGGGTWPEGTMGVLKSVAKAFFLRTPFSEGVFAGQPYALLNGAVWTIPHEFACYMMIAALGLLGLLRQRGAVLVLCLLAAALMLRHPLPWQPSSATSAPTPWQLVLAQVTISWRFVMLFLAGSLFHLFSADIPWRRDMALGALVGLCAALFLPPPQAEIGFAVFGGYLIFYLAQAARGTVWARINARNDISYGIYLYGWPVQKLVWWYFPTAPWPLALAVTLALAVGFGWASWLCVERPALRWARQRPRTR